MKELGVFDLEGNMKTLILIIALVFPMLVLAAAQEKDKISPECAFYHKDIDCLKNVTKSVSTGKCYITSARVGKVIKNMYCFKNTSTGTPYCCMPDKCKIKAECSSYNKFQYR